MSTVPPEDGGSPEGPPDQRPANAPPAVAPDQPPPGERAFASDEAAPPEAPGFAPTGPAWNEDLPAEPWLEAAAGAAQLDPLRALTGRDQSIAGGARSPFSPFGQPSDQPSVAGAPAAAEGVAPPFEPPPLPPAEEQRARPRRGAGRLMRELAETVILAVIIFLVVRAAVQNFQVEGSSMQPTLKDGLYLLVNKAVYFEINLDTVHKFVPFIDPGDDPTRYLFRGPRRGDVIVFVAPQQQPGQPERDFIKRIIGQPGDTVEVRQGLVLINGRGLKEDYVLEKPDYVWGPQTVPPGHYFVLGDNRNNSFDSHAWSDPFLPKENIIGMAWFTYWKDCKPRWSWCPAFDLVSNTSVEPGSADPDQPAAQPTLQPLPERTAVFP